MSVRLLSSGVDSLYVSATGGLRSDVLSALGAAQARAQHERESVLHIPAKMDTESD